MGHITCSMSIGHEEDTVKSNGEKANNSALKMESRELCYRNSSKALWRHKERTANPGQLLRRDIF